MSAEAPAEMLSTSPGVDPWAYEEKPDLQALPMGLRRGRLHLKGDPPRTRGLDTSKHEDLFLINDVASSPVQMKLEPQNSQLCEDLQNAPRSGYQDFKARWWSGEEDEGHTSDSQDSVDLEPGKNSTRGLVTFKQEDFLMSNDDSSSSVSLKKEPPESQSREGQESQVLVPKDFKKQWWSNEEQGHAWDLLDTSDTGHVKTFFTGVDTFRPEGVRVSDEGQISTVKVKLEPKETPIIFRGSHNPLHIGCQDFDKSWRPGEEDEGPHAAHHDTTGLDTFKPNTVTVPEGEISHVNVKLKLEEPSIFEAHSNPLNIGSQEFQKRWWSDEEDERQDSSGTEDSGRSQECCQSSSKLLSQWPTLLRKKKKRRIRSCGDRFLVPLCKNVSQTLAKCIP